ncbi:MAG: hypothetical protein PHE51_00920 [Eubacteriales bacterium]|nr:hypothetical protein [Eubacteriales bacterium]
MKPIDIYTRAHKKLEDVTPLPVDCGMACEKACCDGDEDTGMYLFPYEESILVDAQFLKIVLSDFEYRKGECAKLALCTPPCDRALRPLACRIFPLFPYITTDGNLRIIMDPRANLMCPIARRLEVIDLDRTFVRRVENIFKFLIRFEDIETYLFELSRQMDF